MSKKLLYNILVLATVFAFAAAGVHAEKGGKGGGGGKPSKGGPPVLLIAGGTLGNSKITAVDSDGGNKQTVASGIWVAQGTWSPDGRFAAFFSRGSNLNADCPSEAIGLAELDPATNTWGEPTKLVCKTGATAIPSFSPIIINDEDENDVYTLAYFDHVEPTEDLNVIAFRVTETGVETCGPFNLGQPGINEIGPTWSPAGNEIAVRTLGASGWDLQVFSVAVTLDGEFCNITSVPLERLIQDTQQLFDPSLVDFIGFPDWSRNSDAIALPVQLDGEDIDIWCIDRNSGAMVNLTQHLDDQEGEIDDRDATWLPDDNGMVFIRGDDVLEMTFDEPFGSCLVDPSNSSVRRLSKKRGAGTRDVDYLRFNWPSP